MSNTIWPRWDRLLPRKSFVFLIMLMCFVLIMLANWSPAISDNLIEVPEQEDRDFRRQAIVSNEDNNETTIIVSDSTVEYQNQSFLNKLYYKYLQIAQPKPDIVQQVEADEDLDLGYKNAKVIWTYHCDENRGCVRTMREENETVVEPEVCWLNCGTYGALWPYPTQKTVLGNCRSTFVKNNVAFSPTPVPNNEAKELLHEMWDIFLSRLEKLEQSYTQTSSVTEISGSAVTVQIVVADSTTTKVSLDTDESYNISVTSTHLNSLETSKGCDNQAATVLVTINAISIFGARHALETLTQLIAFDKTQKSFHIVNEVSIEDAPVFPYRGILIDTARNFIPLDDLKRMIDGMAQNKLNIFHWHLTDSNSFPFYCKSVPQMTQYGAYGSDKIYYPNEVQDLLSFAQVRGVKIIPELDAPAHAGNGWQWGHLEGLGDLAVCVNKEPWRNYCGQPPCGQLNPTNPNTFSVLEKVYRDFFDVFDDDLFHMGGDEVYSQCWANDPKISTSKDPRFNFMKLWGTFQEEAWIRLQRANEGNPLKAIVWTSGMTATSSGRIFLNSSNYIIQVWDGSFELTRKLLHENYQLIMSNIEAAYLDQGGGTWLGRDHVYTYRLWQSFYDNHLPRFISNFKADQAKPPEERQILGSEATLWSEKVNNQNIDSKTWPRSCALAENLWSNPTSRNSLVYSRLNHHNIRLIRLGIHSDQLQPESCYLLTGSCDDPQHHI